MSRFGKNKSLQRTGNNVLQYFASLHIYYQNDKYKNPFLTSDRETEHTGLVIHVMKYHCARNSMQIHELIQFYFNFRIQEIGFDKIKCYYILTQENKWQGTVINKKSSYMYTTRPTIKPQLIEYLVSFFTFIVFTCLCEIWLHVTCRKWVSMYG